MTDGSKVTEEKRRKPSLRHEHSIIFQAIRQHNVLVRHVRGRQGPLFGVGWILVLIWKGLAMEDAGWPLSPFMCFGCSDAPGRGRRPDYGGLSRLPLLRPVALHTLDMDRDLQGQQVRADSEGWLHRIRAARRPVQRPMPGSAGVVCSSLPVRPGARRPPAPGLIERTVYREGLGAGPIRPLFRLKERQSPVRSLTWNDSEPGRLSIAWGSGKGHGTRWDEEMAAFA